MPPPPHCSVFTEHIIARTGTCGFFQDYKSIINLLHASIKVLQAAFCPVGLGLLLYDLLERAATFKTPISFCDAEGWLHHSNAKPTNISGTVQRYSYFPSAI